MNEINCIVMSLENGLTNQYLDIPPATLSILQDMKQKGLVLGLCSSRSIHWILRYLQKKRIPSLFSFLIGYNGAQYCNLEEKKWTTLCSFKLPTILEVAKQVENLPVSCGVSYKDELFFDKPGFYALAYALKVGKKFQTQGFKKIPEDATFSRIFILGSKTLLQKIEAKLSIPDTKILHFSSSGLDIVPASCNMYTALQLALEQFHINWHHVLYFGTSDKDIPALENTFGIAMKGASPLVMESSVRSTKYNGAQDGVGYMINSLHMEKNCLFRKSQLEIKEELDSKETLNQTTSLTNTYTFYPIEDKPTEFQVSLEKDLDKDLEKNKVTDQESKSNGEVKIPHLGFTHDYMNPDHELVDEE